MSGLEVLPALLALGTGLGIGSVALNIAGTLIQSPARLDFGTGRARKRPGARRIHCLIKMEIGAVRRRSQELLEQEAEDLVLFAPNPGPHRRISHSTICEVNEERLRKLGPAPDTYISKSAEINFYVS
jgi:hypothetical protein